MVDELPDFNEVFREWDGDLHLLRQNHLLAESQIISFAQDRGIPVFSGDPAKFVGRGWLESDERIKGSELLFHPFRIYTLHRILAECRLPIAASASLSKRDQFLSLVEQILKSRPNIEHIREVSQKCDRIIDLAILLEPIYWPTVIGQRIGRFELPEEELEKLREKYKQKVLALVLTLPSNLWRTMHESLRFDAAQFDGNSELYVLLRLAKWDRRKGLNGSVAGALWFRQIAEVIRRAFEEVHNQEWPEEHEGFGLWTPEARKWSFGSHRALDDQRRANRYVAWLWGLFTGSLIRWYVEGETEYYAIRHVLGDPANVGIELINLKGMIKTGKGNIALRLQDLLVEDKALHRFSMISFDTDAQENVKVVQQQVKQNNVIGSIAAHQPDFEFHNFALVELVEVAARLDESKGFCGDVLRGADWCTVFNARALEENYVRISNRRSDRLKGKDWGEALAAFALETLRRSDDVEKRPLWAEIRAALTATGANYDYQREHYELDPQTFALIPTKPSADSSG